MCIVVELRAENVLRRHDALERRHHHLARCGRDHVEREAVAPDATPQEIDERTQPVLETHAFAGFDEVLAADAAEFGVVADQVGELTTLLYQVAAREARDLVLEVGDAEQLGQLGSGIVMTERLIEIGREQEMFSRLDVHKLLHSFALVRECRILVWSDLSSRIAAER